jgi:uncharacterized protein
MKRVIIIHRWEGSSQDDWRPWIKELLIKEGYEVLIPDMPDTNAPVIEGWVRKIEEVVGVPDINTYFIGHSMGCQAILRYLELINTPVGGAIFVAGWFNLDNLESDEIAMIAKPWIETPVNLEKIKSVLPVSILCISDDDPYGCFDENQKLFSQFVTSTCVVPNAGHFVIDSAPCIIEELHKLFTSESHIKRFNSEGFSHIFAWHDDPYTKYEEHVHRGRVSFYITKGSVTFTSGFDKVFREGERFDVPPGVKHSAVVGPEGCDWVVAEEIEGDS